MVGLMGKHRWTQDKGKWDVASELPAQAAEQVAEEQCGGAPPNLPGPT